MIVDGLRFALVISGSREEGRYRRLAKGTRREDMILHEKDNSNPHGARPVHQIISMINWTWTSKLSVKISFSGVSWFGFRVPGSGLRASSFGLLVIWRIGCGPEAQVGDGEAARLLRIILEVAL